MSFGQALLIAVILALLLYGAVIVTLVVAGRGVEARAFAWFVPDCLVLFQRLLTDPRVELWRKALLVAAIVYLVSPIDLVPDFIPVIGHLDDAIVVVLALRLLLRGSGRRLVVEHWPGPMRSLRVLTRLAY